VINCAGLYADEIAAMLGNRSYRIYPVRGEYCETGARKIVSGEQPRLSTATQMG